MSVNRLLQYLEDNGEEYGSPFRPGDTGCAQPKGQRYQRIMERRETQPSQTKGLKGSDSSFLFVITTGLSQHKKERGRVYQAGAHSSVGGRLAN